MKYLNEKVFMKYPNFSTSLIFPMKVVVILYNELYSSGRVNQTC